MARVVAWFGCKRYFCCLLLVLCFIYNIFLLHCIFSAFFFAWVFAEQHYPLRHKWVLYRKKCSWETAFIGRVWGWRVDLEHESVFNNKRRFQPICNIYTNTIKLGRIETFPFIFFSTTSCILGGMGIKQRYQIGRNTLNIMSLKGRQK